MKIEKRNGGKQMRRWKTKRKDGGIFLFSMMLALLVGLGMPMKVYADENASTDCAKYYIWHDKVTLYEDGTGVVSTGPVRVSRSGDVTTISLQGNVLGSLWFSEGGKYILEANQVCFHKDLLHILMQP